MTDEIRITRRVALEKMYEFYNLEVVVQRKDFEIFKLDIQEIEKRVQYVRENLGKPKPEISPKRAPHHLLVVELEKAGVDASIVEMEGNIIRLTKYLRNKDDWTKYNNVFKDAGYKWVKDGKESRWER